MTEKLDMQLLARNVCDSLAIPQDAQVIKILVTAFENVYKAAQAAEREALEKQGWEPWTRADGTPLICGICNAEILRNERGWHRSSDGKIVYHECCSYQQQIKNLTLRLAAEREAVLEEANWWKQHFHNGHSRNCTFDNATGDEGDYCSCGLAQRRREVDEHIRALKAQTLTP